MLVINKIINFFKLSYVFFLLFLINIFYWIMLRCLSFRALIQISKKKLYIPISSNVNINHIIKIQNIISYLIPFNTCLISALSVNQICKKLLMDSKVIIGICNSNNEFKSHAWVKIESKVFFDIPEENYHAILEL